MNNSIIQDVITQQKNEDITSKTSSSFIQRIQRRREETSTHRRSLPRKSLQSKQQSLEISKFYTKMGNNKEPLLMTPVRQNKLINVQSPREIKKRQPTPLPGKGKQKNNQSKSPHRNQIEKQLQLAQFSRRLQDEKQRKIIAERRAQTFEKELRIKIKRIKELQQELQGLKGENKETNNQLLDEGIKLKIVSQSGVQSLKANFLQIRIQQLQKMNNELTQQLNLKNTQLQKMRVENETLKEENQLFKQQIFTLNQRSESALLSLKQRQISLLKQQMRFSTSQRQIFLGNLLQQCQQEKLNLQNRIRYLQLKISFIHRRQNEELRDVIKRKDKDIATIRKKLSILASQSLRYRKEIQSNFQNKRARQSLLTKCDSHSLRSDSWSFSLSPERDDF